MMVMANEEHIKKQKQSIMSYKNKEANIAISVLSNQNNEIGYGLMAYQTYYVQGQLLSHYKIYYTSNNLDKMLNYTKHEMIDKIKNKIKVNLLFYKVENIEPKLVSYHFITSSTFQWLKILLTNKTSVCQFYGNTQLHKQMYDYLDFLKDYQLYKNNINLLSKNEIKVLYHGISTKTRFRKSSMIKYLLKHQILLIQ